MNAGEVALRAAKRFGPDVERAVKMELRAQKENKAKKAIDLVAAVAVASLIIQCAQFAIELRRQGRQPDEKQLSARIDALLEQASPLPAPAKQHLIDDILDAASG
jgi:hypothetical protein